MTTKTAKRYELKRGEELTPEKIMAFIKDYESNTIPQMNQNLDYYEGRTAILNRTMSNPDKPNNKRQLFMAETIVDTIADYLVGNGVKYESNDVDFLDKLLDIAANNDDESIIKDTALDMGIFGKAYNLHYINEETLEFEYMTVDPRTAFSVYKKTNPKKPAYTVRFYAETKGELEVEVYGLEEDIYYRQIRDGLVEVEREANILSGLRLVEASVPRNVRGDAESVKGLIDALELAINGEINEREAFEMAYLVLEGMAGATDEELQQIAGGGDNAMLMPNGGKAGFLTKVMDVNYIKDYRETLLDLIFFTARIPNPFKLEFGKNTSGEAMKIHYKNIEPRMKKRATALSKLIKERANLVASYLEVIGEGTHERNTTEVKICGNVVVSTSEQVLVAKELVGLGVVSNQTILGALPSDIVEDVGMEIERVKEERAGDIYASFDTANE